MCDMGNKLWYERDLFSCDSFTRHLLVANPTGTCSLWHLAPNKGPGAFCLCESKTVENAQKCKKWFPVQLTLLHEHSVFWGLERTNQGTEVLPCGQGFSRAAQLIPRARRPQQCCHVVMGPQGLPRWFQGPWGPEQYPATQASRGRAGASPCCPGNCKWGPEPKTCERVRKWHFPWIGKAHGFKEETQSELYFIILLNFNIFSQSIVKEVQPSCVSHIGFQFYQILGFQPALVLGVPNQVRLSMVHFNIPIFPIGYNGKLQIF